MSLLDLERCADGAFGGDVRLFAGGPPRTLDVHVPPDAVDAFLRRIAAARLDVDQPASTLLLCSYPRMQILLHVEPEGSAHGGFVLLTSNLHGRYRAPWRVAYMGQAYTLHGPDVGWALEEWSPFLHWDVLHAMRERFAAPDGRVRPSVEIDGSLVFDSTSFCNQVSKGDGLRLREPTLDALDEALDDLPLGGLVVHWHDADHTRAVLGHAALARWLADRLKHAAPHDAHDLRKRLEDAQSERGQTLFETIVATLEAYATDGVELRLR